MDDVVPLVLSALARGPMDFCQVTGAVRVPDGQVLEALLWGAERGLVGRMVLADGRVAWCRTPSADGSQDGGGKEAAAQPTQQQPEAPPGAATPPPPQPPKGPMDTRAGRLALAALIVAILGTLANLLLNLLG